MRRGGILPLQYLAGLFDGEGCVLVGKTHRRRRAYPSGSVRREYDEYTLVANLSNSNHPVLDAIKESYGGQIYPMKSRRNKPMWAWVITRKAAAGFLHRLWPYLRIKWYEVWLALNYAAEVHQNRRGPGKRLSDEDRALREGYYLALRAAKRLGGVSLGA